MAKGLEAYYERILNQQSLREIFSEAGNWSIHFFLNQEQIGDVNNFHKLLIFSFLKIHTFWNLKIIQARFIKQRLKTTSIK